MVRLIGVSLYTLSDETHKQLSFNDILGIVPVDDGDAFIHEALTRLQKKYGLDFSGHLEELYHGTVLHKTIEYIRKHP